MENKDIAKNFIKEVSHYMPDMQIVLMLQKILGDKNINYNYVRHLREELYIHNGQRMKTQKDRIGLDLYDHRLDKNRPDSIIKQEKKS